VIRQVPPAGPAPGAPTQVEVVVSKGWQVQVPSVTGLTQRVATERLRQSGLVVAVASRRDGSMARGLAVGSTPSAGRTAEPGSRVTLIISAGRPRAPAPGYGTLSVSAEPAGCEVWVYVDGGDPRGTCPLTVRLAPGDHAVTLWDTSHEPGAQQDLRVEIADGASTKLHRRMH
jgi:beta-lactam-binding protein with PASTA domain